MCLPSTSWVLYSLPPHPSARKRARVCTWSSARHCVLDGQAPRSISGAREGPSLYPVDYKASQLLVSSLWQDWFLNASWYLNPGNRRHLKIVFTHKNLIYTSGGSPYVLPYVGWKKKPHTGIHLHLLLSRTYLVFRTATGQFFVFQTWKICWLYSLNVHLPTSFRNCWEISLVKAFHPW